MMEPKLLNIGFGNTVLVNRIVAIVSPASAPMKRLKEDAKQANKLVDATMGRRTRSIIITDSDHVILSGVQAETIAQRLIAENHPKNGHVSKQEKE
jgi:extracellular matrix regulatory protein A